MLRRWLGRSCLNISAAGVQFAESQNGFGWNSSVGLVKGSADAQQEQSEFGCFNSFNVPLTQQLFFWPTPSELLCEQSQNRFAHVLALSASGKRRWRFVPLTFSVSEAIGQFGVRCRVVWQEKTLVG